MPKVVRIKRATKALMSENHTEHLESLVSTLQSQVKNRESDIGSLNTQLNEVHDDKDVVLNILREEYTYHVLRSLALKRELQNFGIEMPN